MAEKIYGKEGAQLLGLYDDGGYADKRRKAYFDLDKDGKPYVVNGGGGHTVVELEGNKMYASNWKLKGSFEPNSKTIYWENGSVWVQNIALPRFEK